jgi:hypothetical protein
VTVPDLNKKIYGTFKVASTLPRTKRSR